MAYADALTVHRRRALTLSQKGMGDFRFSAINSEIYKSRSTNYLTETENDRETTTGSGNGNRKGKVSGIIIDH